VATTKINPWKLTRITRAWIQRISWDSKRKGWWIVWIGKAKKGNYGLWGLGSFKNKARAKLVMLSFNKGLQTLAVHDIITIRS
jgi:hypothetical protein